MRTLWYDRRLSIDQQVSCNTCHLLDRYGVDGLPRSLGHTGLPVARNAQSVYNAAFHISQFWDGRSATTEEQA
nr:cytochrome-c peroxidase [Caldilineaceae bacterium]